MERMRRVIAMGLVICSLVVLDVGTKREWGWPSSIGALGLCVVGIWLWSRRMKA